LENTLDDYSNIPLFGFIKLDDADDRSNPTLSNFRNPLSTLQQDTLLPFCADMWVNFCWLRSSLVDGGANVCITNDPSLLLDIVQINPVPLGMAVDTNCPGADPTLLCTHKGFIPLPLLDGLVHCQPCLNNLHASDTIISLENVINNNHRFHHCCQEG
jgi:hypothetical protein